MSEDARGLEAAGVEARQFTEMEDAATKVERQVGKSAVAILLESRIGEQSAALVTGASDKGTWARLLTVAVEGRVERGFIDFRRVDAKGAGTWTTPSHS